MRRLHGLPIVFVFLLALPLAAKDSRKELVVTLKFVPQEGVQTTRPELSPDLLERAVDLRVEDGRKLAEASVIGQGTNGDDESFPIKSSGDVMSYVDSTLKDVAKNWSIVAGTNERVLTISVMRFTVDESNKALGSVYAADVQLAFQLADAKGRTIARGTASGEAHRYGRARSGDNCSEVLSDALKDAFSGVLSDSALQSAWMTGKASSTSTQVQQQPKESPEERLKKLEELYKKGVITKDEYEKKRAEILKEL